MTDRQFVKLVYPDAKFVRTVYEHATVVAIQLTKPSPQWWTFGYKVNKTPRQMWAMTKKEINKRMMQKLES
jgi:hypothetical protein